MEQLVKAHLLAARKQEIKPFIRYRISCTMKEKPNTEHYAEQHYDGMVYKYSNQ